MSHSIIFPPGTDFSETLPHFRDAREFQNGDKQKVWNFGLGDIIGVPGLSEVCERTLQRMAPTAARLLMRLPGMQGALPFCERLAELIAQETGIRTTPNEILLTSGGCDGITIATLACCPRKSGVAYAVPSFPYWCVLQHTGVRQFPLAFSNPTEYRDCYASRMIEFLAANPGIKAVIFNEPQNPMGVPIRDDQLKKFGDYVGNNDITVIVDDVGRGLVQMVEGGWWGRYLPADKMIIIDSFTKRYACPGLRLGFIRAEKDQIRSMRGLVANWRAGISNVCAEFGSQLFQEFDRTGQNGIVKNEILLRFREFSKALPNLSSEFVQVHRPAWGLYCLLDFTNLEKATGIGGRQAVELIRRKGVLTLNDTFLFPPSCEDSCRNNIVRLSIGGTHDVQRGMESLIDITKSLNSSSS